MRKGVTPKAGRDCGSPGIPLGVGLTLQFTLRFMLAQLPMGLRWDLSSSSGAAERNICRLIKEAQGPLSLALFLGGRGRCLEWLGHLLS